ncbi:GNAT family N-acetyltransferase [Streptomyces cynarae]
MVPGLAVAGFLWTAIVKVGGQPPGFVSIDGKRYSIEVIYVTPEHRGHGVATMILVGVARACPQQLALKAPLSPGGEALGARLGLPSVESTPEEIREMQETIQHAEIPWPTSAGRRGSCRRSS